MSNMEISYERRPCYLVNADLSLHVKALFHGWVTKNNTPYGILEFEDGTVGIEPSDAIRFADNMISQYAFKPFEQMLNESETKIGELFNDHN